MKEAIRALLPSVTSPAAARNLVREYLQARILESLQHIGAMTSIAFLGGTALRFLYAIPRYSEDLDFALEQQHVVYNFRGWLETIRSNLTAEGYTVDLRINDQKVVHSAFVRFSGLLHDVGLSPHASEVIAIKLEIDTNPPPGANLTTTLVRRHVTLNLHHHDRASLLAGKLHAILQRSYVKGRDLYDLFWYLSDPQWPHPNLVWLNNALQQSNWTGEPLTDLTWQQAIIDRINTMDWERVISDVEPFLERGFEIQLLTRENLLGLLARK
jgi:predicted nucleotidyltransferase component of viral defense system